MYRLALPPNETPLSSIIRIKDELHVRPAIDI
jgi:hypothetical protein